MTAPFEALPAATRDSLLVGYLSAAWSRSPQRLDDYPDIAMLEATDHAAWTDGQSLRHAAHMVWTADGSGDYYRDCAAYDAIATRLNATYADRMVILTTDPDRPGYSLGLRGFRIVPFRQETRSVNLGPAEHIDCLALAREADALDRHSGE